MSSRAMEWAINQKVGWATGKAVLLVMAFYADEDGGVFIQVNQVARDACCSVPCASRWITNLAERGFLTKRRVGTRHTGGLFIQLNMNSEK